MTAPDLEAEPPAAAAVFGEQQELARMFVRDLAQYGELLGLIGPLERPRLWTRHVVNSGLVAPLVRGGARVGDVGSGAGLPGMVLALARPDARFTLIEPMERRAAWLADEAARLGLGNVEVLRSRAEEIHLAQGFDQVTARAVSALRTLIPLAAPLLRPGGELILMKGSGAAAEIASAQKEIRRFHLSVPEIVVLGSDFGTENTWVVRATVD
ncbi:MAG: 16S rRNA (guanine(527)-N(7))-methyltransferase RsmG [Microbacteriaceae bacterium]